MNEEDVMHQRQRTADRRGLTLIELLIVIAILLALGGIVAVNLIPKKGEAEANIVRAQIDQMAEALDHFRLDLNRYPTTDEGLRVLWVKADIESEDDQALWKSAYLSTPASKDSWNNDWIYRAPSEIREGAAYDIISIGPDREEGTDDDITNHDRFRDADGEIAEEFDDFTAPESGDQS